MFVTSLKLKVNCVGVFFLKIMANRLYLEFFFVFLVYIQMLVSIIEVSSILHVSCPSLISISELMVNRCVAFRQC